MRCRSAYGRTYVHICISTGTSMSRSRYVVLNAWPVISCAVEESSNLARRGQSEFCALREVGLCVQRLGDESTEWQGQGQGKCG